MIKKCLQFIFFLSKPFQILANETFFHLGAGDQLNIPIERLKMPQRRIGVPEAMSQNFVQVTPTKSAIRHNFSIVFKCGLAIGMFHFKRYFL